MTRKCINCKWQGEVAGADNRCPVCGDNTVELAEEVKEPKPKKHKFDLDGDGDFDKDDKKIAAKVLASGKRKKKKKFWKK